MNTNKMTCPPEHVATWMIGVQFQKQLDPLQNRISIVFMHAHAKQSKGSLGAPDDFRNAHFNKYLYELQRPMEGFIERLKKIDDIKKPVKKDYATLFKDLQSFKRVHGQAAIEMVNQFSRIGIPT